MNFIILSDKAKILKENLEAFGIYNVIVIDKSVLGVPNYDTLDNNKSAHEFYDETWPLQAITELFKDVNLTEDAAVYINVSEEVSGASLRVLKYLTESGCKSVEVFLNLEDLSFSSKEKKMYSKVTFNVMQEYARSGLLDTLFLLDENRCERALTGLTLKNRERMISSFVCNIIHNYYYSKNTNKVIDFSAKYSDTCRIATIGLLDFDTQEIFYTFDLKNSDGRCTFLLEANNHFLISNERIEDEELITQIKKIMDSRRSAYDSLGYSVIETEITQVVVVEKTSMIQTMEHQ